MRDFLSGMITMGFLTGGLFFLKFLRQSGDRLFLAFAVAFWLLAANQALTTIVNVPNDERSWIYLLRIAAFIFITIAIIQKNARRLRADE